MSSEGLENGTEGREPRELAGGELILDFPADAVARLTLNNPDKRNPLSHPVLDAIAETLPLLDHGIDVRCVLITGAGKAFSAGYDIGAIPDDTFERDAEALVAHPFTAAMEAISAHPYPVIAAINGHCLGGGLELAVRCDLRVCAAEAKLGMPPAKLGLIYGHTGLERFIDTVGVPRTKELFLTGRVFDGARAEEIGLVHEVHPAAEVADRALEVASLIAGNAPLSLRGNKYAIETLSQFPRLSPKQVDELVALRESCFASEDFKEGVRAFGEKRPPEWKGR
ncbi:MAG: enoyl-CoA hydratase-related protein [Solirubrobacterales bacterium]